MGDIQKNSNSPKWLSMTNWHLPRAFAMNNDNKDICHLPLPEMELCAPVTANLQHPLREIQEFSASPEALCAPGKLVE